jgi:hypothetical protein
MPVRFIRSRWPAVALAAALLGTTAFTLAETGARARSPRLSPTSRLQAEPGRRGSSADSRDVRTLIEELESSTPDEVRSGKIGRFFTDPAAIITNGRLHHIDWSRIRDDRPADRQRDEPDAAPREPADRPNADARDPADRRDQDARDPADRPNADARDRNAPQNADVSIESFETRRIDSRTLVALYTAVIPGDNGAIRQPVVATVVREPGQSNWRIASYTADNAAIPGDAAADDTAPDRGRTP